MKKRILTGFAIGIGLFTLLSTENVANWDKSGSASKDYIMGANIKGNDDGSGTVTIKSKTNSVSGYGALIHNLSAQTFQGKRVRISGLIRSMNVNDWGGFWINTNQAVSNKAVSMETIHHSTVSGTSKGYQYCQVVVDVPANSSGIAYGAMLKGAGQIYAARVQFEIVPSNTPLTN